MHSNSLISIFRELFHLYLHELRTTLWDYCENLIKIPYWKNKTNRKNQNARITKSTTL